MLYKKNSSEKLSPALFRNPTAEYRGTPFWAWNTDLDRDELFRQIEIFKKMGFGGFHMHVRTGMSTVYLSDEFMNLIKGCTEKAKEENMLAWLYDEDRWPSGGAGGYVTKDERFRARNLLMTKQEQSEDFSGDWTHGRKFFITCYDISLDGNGRLESYAKISKDAPAAGSKWYVYLEIDGNSTWHNNQSYVDTLNKKAIERFVEITHERYKEYVGGDFDGAVPAIFTDEPQFSRKKCFDSSLESTESRLPWTDDFPDTFKAAYGFDIFDRLPELFWEGKEGTVSKARYFYHDHICERFTEAFSDTIGEWCEKNNIHLTGHMMEEPSLESQTAAIGEAMRAYRSFGLPGIDMLCASFEFTTAKQTQSAKNQFGREGMLSELYGVTGWDYDFRGYKLHGDWQTCLGVSVRVPHLSWVAMGGEAKRDYPASISYQSPWWEEYSYIEDHFARVNALMTRGRPVVKVGVIHPIESYWLHFGPRDLTDEIRDAMDRRFKSLTEWLLKGSADFDFISESLLPALCPEGSNPLKVGEMSYDTIIVPGCESLRSTTIERLEKFRESGGRLIFLGDAPSVSDGEISGKGAALYDKSEKIPFDRESVLAALESGRTVKIEQDGKLSDGFIYRLMRDGDGLNLFISRACEPDEKSSVKENRLVITVKGEYFPVEFDTQTGDIRPVSYVRDGKNTVISAALYDYGSLMLRLSAEEGEYAPTAGAKEQSFTGAAESVAGAEYELSEDNVYLIDMCEYSLDGGDFAPEEEILRLDNICREKTGLNLRGGHVAQPWVLPPETIVHSLTLRKVIESEIDYEGALLAIEKPQECAISFNGESVSPEVTGWYTDKDIKTLKLPAIRKGRNELVVTLPLGNSTNTEWMYILGSFGVKVSGCRSVITALPAALSFGDITSQGLPFYGGNITYRIKAAKSGRMCVTVPEYYGALISVSTEKGEKGKIVYPPYKLAFDAGEGETVEIKLYGNRQNCFGPVHRTIPNGWIGPYAWRTEGDEWSYDYCLKKVGITKPVMVAYEENS